MTEREVLKLALKCAERCESIDGMYSWTDTITAIKEALAQPEQEPVGFTIQAEIDYAKNNPKEYAGFWANKDDDDEDWIALYTNPPQRKPLTRGQIREIEVDVSLNPSFDYITPAEQLCRAIEAAHGIKEQK